VSVGIMPRTYLAKRDSRRVRIAPARPALRMTASEMLHRSWRSSNSIDIYQQHSPGVDSFVHLTLSTRFTPISYNRPSEHVSVSLMHV